MSLFPYYACLFENYFSNTTSPHISLIDATNHIIIFSRLRLDTYVILSYWIVACFTFHKIISNSLLLLIEQLYVFYMKSRLQIHCSITQKIQIGFYVVLSYGEKHRQTSHGFATLLPTITASESVPNRFAYLILNYST